MTTGPDVAAESISLKFNVLKRSVLTPWHKTRCQRPREVSPGGRRSLESKGQATVAVSTLKKKKS